MDAVTEERRRGLRALFRVRDFRLLLGSTAISATGDWLYGIALLVYLYDRTHSASWIAAANIVRFLPYVFFSTFGGLIADRYDRRRLMIVIDTMRGALMVVLAVLVSHGGAPVFIVALTAVTAIVNAPYQPCVNAAVPAVVREEDLAGANAVLATVENLALVVGPALGGLLLVLGSPTVAFAGNAASFFISALLLAQLRSPLQAVSSEQDVDADTGVARRLAEGFRAIGSNATAAMLVALSVALTFAYGLEVVLYPLVASQLLHTPDGLALMFAAIGLGGIAAAALTGRASRSTRPAAIIVFAGAISALPIMTLVFVHRPPVAYALLAVEGAATIVADVTTMTMLQRVVSGEVLGRVMGILDSLAVTGILLGSGLAPVLVTQAGLKPALIVAGVVVLTLTMLVLPRARAIDRIAADSRAELAQRVASLSAAEMFEAAPPATLEALAGRLIAEHVAAGTDVVRAGDQSDDIWLVAAGTLAVTSRGQDEKEVVVNRLAPGDYFGEIGLLHHVPRTATVTASSDCDLWRLDGDDFLRIVNHGVGTSARLRAGIATRLARTDPGRTMEQPT